MTDETIRETPNNIEAEQALLGAILVNNAAWDRVSSFLEAEHFYEPLHRKIYTITVEMIRMGKLANPVTIKTFLPSKEKVGGMTVAHYLVRLAAESVTIINAADYGRAILDLAIRRKMISIGQDLVNIAYDAPVDVSPKKIIMEAESRLVEMLDDGAGEGARLDIGEEYYAEMVDTAQRGFVRGVPIVLDEIARVISEPCFEEANYYGMLSSSSEGKTSLMVQIILHALEQGNPVQVQSFDQSGKQFVRQMVAQKFGIEARRQRGADLSQSEWAEAREFAHWIGKVAPLEVIRCSTENAPQLVHYASNFIRRPNRRVAKALADDKVPLIVTDHIGSISPEEKIGGGRKQDPGSEAKGINKVIKSGAAIVNAAWLMLQQRNTYGMQRDNPRPIGADIFGGDPAKQAFDAIFYLYRYAKFCKERVDVANSDSDWKKIHAAFPADVISGNADIAEIGALKVRFGDPSIKEDLDFEGRFTRYTSRRPTAQQQELLAVGFLQ